MEHFSGVGRNSSVDDRQLTGPWPEVTNLLTGQCPGTLRPLWKGGITEIFLIRGLQCTRPI